jgi:exopolysaccharide biosynthesis protein
MPEGVTISQGKLTNAMGGADLTTVGFDENNVLIMGKMTRDQAVQRGLRDAVSFGPALVVNGEAAVIKGSSSGLNPRTAIGQRSDGAILMLVIEGRQPSRLGASYLDEAELMLRFGAVNASNMDGGSSTMMWYNGEYINNRANVINVRYIPTSWVVLKEGRNGND